MHRLIDSESIDYPLEKDGKGSIMIHVGTVFTSLLDRREDRKGSIMLYVGTVYTSLLDRRGVRYPCDRYETYKHFV